MTPAYTAGFGRVFRQGRPITLEAAQIIVAVHRSNRDHWLTRDDLSQAARLQIATIENDLADEMTAAIAEAREQERAVPVEQKEAA